MLTDISPLDIEEHQFTVNIVVTNLYIYLCNANTDKCKIECLLTITIPIRKQCFN